MKRPVCSQCDYFIPIPGGTSGRCHGKVPDSHVGGFTTRPQVGGHDRACPVFEQNPDLLPPDPKTEEGREQLRGAVQAALADGSATIKAQASHSPPKDKKNQGQGKPSKPAQPGATPAPAPAATAAKAAVAMLAMLCLLLVGCASPGPITHGIPNLHQAAPGVWRGGQPTPAGWEWLAAQGVTNVVKLNTDSEAPDWPVASTTVRYFTIDLWHQTMAEPNYRTVLGAALWIGPGTFVHCQHGQDRTGLVVACWRLWLCGWTKEQAQAEMLGYGFHRSLRGLWEFWEHAPPLPCY